MYLQWNKKMHLVLYKRFNESFKDDDVSEIKRKLPLSKTNGPFMQFGFSWLKQ